MISTLFFLLSFLGLCSAQECNQAQWEHGMIGGADSPWCFQASEFPEYPAKNGKNGPCTSDVCKVYDEVESKEKCHDIVKGSALCDDKWGFQYSENGGRCWAKGDDGTHSSAGDNWWVGPIDRENSCQSVWYPNYSATWTDGHCLNSASTGVDSTFLTTVPNYGTQEECCAASYSGQTSGACLQEDSDSTVPINECVMNTHDCGDNAYCIDTPDSYECHCQLGYTGDGRSCEVEQEADTVQCPGFDFYCDCADDCMAGGNTHLCSCPEAQTCCDIVLDHGGLDFPSDGGCESGWTSYGSHCYQRQPEALLYDDAQAYCETQGSYLAVPNTQDENTFLASTMNPSSVGYTWIGFDFTNNEKWEDGSDSSQSDSWRILYNVDDAADRDNGEPATFIRPSGDWSFDAKSHSFSYICEKPMSSYDAIPKQVVKRLLKIVPTMVRRTKGNIRRVVKRMKKDIIPLTTISNIISDIDQNVDIDGVHIGQIMEDIHKLNAYYHENGQPRYGGDDFLEPGQVRVLLRVAGTKHQVGFKADLNRQMNKIIDIRDDEGLNYGLTYNEDWLESLTAGSNVPAYDWLPLAYEQYLELSEKYRNDGTMKN